MKAKLTRNKKRTVRKLIHTFALRHGQNKPAYLYLATVLYEFNGVLSAIRFLHHAEKVAGHENAQPAD